MIINFIEKQKMNPEDRKDIAFIIKVGFWGKIGNMFRRVSDEKSLSILEQAITFDKGFYYKEEGIVMGAAVLGTKDIPYMNFDRQARKSLGLWNGFLLQLGFGTVKPKQKDGLKLEMLAVSPEARGKGVGTKMLDHLSQLALKKGYERVSLEVIDSNEKAKHLYEREGFKNIKYVNTSLFTRNVGFRGYYKMQKDAK